MGLVWVLAWPEGWRPLQGCGCAHPGPSLAAIGYLREGEQVQSRPKHGTGPRGWHERPPAPAGRWAGATGAAAPALPGHAGGSAPGCPSQGAAGLLGDSGRPGTPSRRPRPMGAWAAEPRRSGCSSNGFIPAEAGSKAGSDLDGFLLNNGEGAHSLLLLARETRVFQSISFWE